MLGWLRTLRLSVRGWASAWSLLGPVALAACSPQQVSDEAPRAQWESARKQLGGHARTEVSGAANSPFPMSAATLTWVEQQKVLASDGAASHIFGDSVALDGDTALIGARSAFGGGSYGGAAYVLLRAAEAWSEQQRLIASDAASQDGFGTSVSLSGDTALIGAARGEGAVNDTGSAYVYVRAANAWIEQQKLSASDGAVSDSFGSSVSLSGGTALIGAPSDADAGSFTGAAYVFVRAAATWSEQQKLTASDGASGDRLGTAVSLSGDTALIGAYQDASAGAIAGAAYVFVRTGQTWSQQQELLPSDSSGGEAFGGSVSLHGDTALIGAWGDDGASSDTGAAYVYVRAAATWSEQQKLQASDGAYRDGFGSSVSLSGATSLVGAYRDDSVGTDAGSAYAFVRTAATWGQQERLQSSDGAPYDRLGGSVALSGDTALVGAYLDDDGLVEDAGSALFMTLKLVDGEACTSAVGCASGQCVDGRCCDTACDGFCAVCDGLGLEGRCGPAPRGGAPLSDCGGYLCNGDIQGCPQVCAGDSACEAASYCRAATACLPKAVLSEACLRNAGCLSGHCVAGLCCDGACDDGCGSCGLEGLEGVCSPLRVGHPGAPQCAPYLCGGDDVACPSGCQSHEGCAPGHHCASGLCSPDNEQGSACVDDRACTTGHCTDAICCTADACGAYRCGSAGACEDACGSSAQCAAGHQCNSAGQCEAHPVVSDSANESGGCQLGRAPASQSASWWWLAAAASLLGASRRRQRQRCGL